MKDQILRKFTHGCWVAMAVTCATLIGGCSGGSESAESGGKTAETGSLEQIPNPARTQVPPPPSGSGTGPTGLVWEVPDGWTEQTPSSSMRRAQFLIPGEAGEAELVVFYFGPGQGGDAMSNAGRWAGQFRKADGTSAADELVTREAEHGGMKTLLVEVGGIYTNTMVSPEAFPDHALLGAVVEGPDANWFFKMTGPQATVEANRAPFEAFLNSLRRGS